MGKLICNGVCLALELGFTQRSLDKTAGHFLQNSMRIADAGPKFLEKKWTRKKAIKSVLCPVVFIDTSGSRIALQHLMLFLLTRY